MVRVMNSPRWAAAIAGFAVVGASTATVVIVDAATAAASGKVVVKTRTVSPYGKILTTSSGRTLYIFTPDSKGHSVCTGGCATEWPPLIVPKGDTLSGVSGLGTIKRGHQRQAALHGQALYRYAGDSAAGQVNGQGVEGTWFVETPKGPSHASPTPTPTATKSSPPSGGGYGY